MASCEEGTSAGGVSSSSSSSGGDAAIVDAAALCAAVVHASEGQSEPLCAEMLVLRQRLKRLEREGSVLRMVVDKLSAEANARVASLNAKVCCVLLPTSAAVSLPPLFSVARSLTCAAMRAHRTLD